MPLILHEKASTPISVWVKVHYEHVPLEHERVFEYTLPLRNHERQPATEEEKLLRFLRYKN